MEIDGGFIGQKKLGFGSQPAAAMTARHPPPRGSILIKSGTNVRQFVAVGGKR